LLREDGNVISRFQVGDGIVALAIGDPGIVVVFHEESPARIGAQLDLASPSVNIANLANNITSSPTTIVTRQAYLAQLGTPRKAPD
jgi:hypothetical protein